MYDARFIGKISSVYNKLSVVQTGAVGIGTNSRKIGYLGANSAMRWHHVVRVASDKAVPSDSRVVVPLKTGLLPPTTPESIASQSRTEHYLPCYQLSLVYTSRFFAQAHSMHCFFSPEQFYAQLDHTLENKGRNASPSWLCSLYSIYAIGSIRPMTTQIDSDRAYPEDPMGPSGYLALAKELVPRAADDADIESVRAFALLVSTIILHSKLARRLTGFRAWRCIQTVTVLVRICTSAQQRESDSHSVCTVICFQRHSRLLSASDTSGFGGQFTS